MSRYYLVLAFLGIFSLASFAEEPRQFTGWIFTHEGLEDSAPESGFRIIDNEEAMAEFRKKIPKTKPSKKQPAPANDDPLLGKVRLDFAEQRLVLVWRGETISSHPTLVSVEQNSKAKVFKVFLPEPPPEARPYGWGVYRAFLVPRDGKKIEVEFVASRP